MTFFWQFYFIPAQATKHSRLQQTSGRICGQGIACVPNPWTYEWWKSFAREPFQKQIFEKRFLKFRFLSNFKRILKQKFFLFSNNGYIVEDKICDSTLRILLERDALLKKAFRKTAASASNFSPELRFLNKFELKIVLFLVFILFHESFVKNFDFLCRSFVFWLYFQSVQRRHFVSFTSMQRSTMFGEVHLTANCSRTGLLQNA